VVLRTDNGVDTPTAMAAAYIDIIGLAHQLRIWQKHADESQQLFRGVEAICPFSVCAGVRIR
jgi:hypothetical protein